MNVIICLGGDYHRNQTAAELAKQNPTAVVLVSSDGPVELGAPYYKDLESRVFWDFNAWDTISNFTETYNWIKEKDPKKLWVVTSDYHMKRSMAIAGPVWFSRNVEVIPVEHPSPYQKDPDPLIYMLRAFLWRLGFSYSGGLIKQRMPGCLAERAKAVSLGLQVTEQRRGVD